MSGYSPYGPRYNGDSFQQAGQSGAGSNMMMMGGDPMDSSGMSGAQSLDDIVNQNARAIRRQSMPHQYGPGQSDLDADMRRVSMMEFSGAGSPAGPLNTFQFDPSTAMGQDDMVGQMQGRPDNSQARQQAGGELPLNTSFTNGGQAYGSMMHPSSSFTPSANPNTGLDMDMGINSPFMQSAMGMSMDYSSDPSLANVMSTDTSAMNMFNQPQYQQTPMMQSPIHTSMSGSLRGPSQDPSNGAMNSQRSYSLPHSRSSSETVRQIPRHQSLQMQDSPQRQGSAQNSQQGQQTPSYKQGQSSGFAAQPQHPEPGSSQDKGIASQNRMNGAKPSSYNPNNQGFPWEPPEGGWPSTMINRPHMQSAYKNAYSSTGFDMLGVLMRVATRPNPEINIGSVDLSCAFVVCDAEKDDFPIVYCSDNFERLTGYTKHMILGRNCRFLQSPDGNVEPGIRRKYVDDDSVLYLKNMINLRREAQISLINYRRGGQPFMNLLTMIPITWDTDQVKFFVGFQVDLVEQPNAVTNRNPDGSYSINYQRGMTMPRYVMNAPESTAKPELGQTVPRDDVSAILATIGSGDSEYAKRMWDKVLLENTDDVVHVLSLKGLFQWVSPSALRVLEYEPGEIIGTALSSVCHPSDIVPVTRELKDTSSGASVNVVFRIRRKNSGYMWFEGHGSLHTEQGKGRKSIIMVGRERPVYTLSKQDIVANGGIGENELWTKMSTSGMFLFVSSNVRQLLDRQPEELVGVSIQSLMRADSKAEFARILELARTGKKASVKHEMINRRGQVLQAFTTLYPGDATEGLKPTFVVAQTRMIKYPRGSQTNRPNVFPKIERNSSESVHDGGNTPSQSLRHPASTNSGDMTPYSALSSGRYISTDGAAATYAGQNGLVIGHQDVSLASDDNLFDELKTTKSSSWQYEIRQLEKRNRLLAEEVQSLLAAKKKRKRRKGAGQLQKDCANCHTRVTPEWRRGPSGQRDLCNSCGLRWAKLNGRVSPRTSSQQSAASDRASKASASPRHASQPVKTESATASGQQAQQSGSFPSNHDSSSGTPHRESHSASMEGAGGVPEKIDEAIEPD